MNQTGNIICLVISATLLLGCFGVNVVAQEFPLAAKVDTTKTIFSSEIGATADGWIPIHDNVMGGVSEGGALLTRDSCLVFSGSLSLENNGGFASIRTTVTDGELSGCNGLKIRVKGDGRSYQLRLRLDSKYDAIAYKHNFSTVDDEWIVIDLPFSSFVPTYRGKILQDVKALVASEIRLLGFLIADKSAGPFRLMVSEIVAYK